MLGSRGFVLVNCHPYRYNGYMAYLRKLKQGKRTYFYIMRSERKGAMVSGKVLEYLGRDPDPARLKAALRYWKVGTKARRGKE